MWPGEELSQTAVNRQVLFNPMEQRVWEEKQKKSHTDFGLFFQKRGWEWKKRKKLFLKSEPSTKNPIVGYCALCNSQSLKKRDLNLLCVFSLHSGTQTIQKLEAQSPDEHL